MFTIQLMNSHSRMNSVTADTTAHKCQLANTPAITAAAKHKHSPTTES